MSMARRLIVVLLPFLGFRERPSLDGTLGTLVLRFASSLFYGRVGDHDDREHNQNDDARKEKPFSPVGRCRNPVVFFAYLAKDQAKDQRWPRPTVEHHEVTQDTEEDRCHQIVQMVVGGE